MFLVSLNPSVKGTKLGASENMMGLPFGRSQGRFYLGHKLLKASGRSVPVDMICHNNQIVNVCQRDEQYFQTLEESQLPHGHVFAASVRFRLVRSASASTCSTIVIHYSHAKNPLFKTNSKLTTPRKHLAISIHWSSCMLKDISLSFNIVKKTYSKNISILFKSITYL